MIPDCPASCCGQEDGPGVASLNERRRFMKVKTKVKAGGGLLQFLNDT